MFVQFHIIAWFSSKINPYLKKISIFCAMTDGDLAPDGTSVGQWPCQYPKFDGIPAPLSKWQGAKKLTFWRKGEKQLCKRNVHNPANGPCGEHLWKTLWRLWKSWHFPQGNRRFSKTGRRIKMHKQLHNECRNGFATVLRHREKKTTNRGFSAVNVLYLPGIDGSGGTVPPKIAKKFVKNRQSAAVYHSRAAGNNGTTNFFGGTPCRER